MDNFLSIAIIGVILSFIIEGINRYLEVNSLGAKIITVVASLVIGGLYFAFSQTQIWESVLGVLASASTVYALLLKKGGS